MVRGEVGCCCQGGSTADESDRRSLFLSFCRSEAHVMLSVVFGWVWGAALAVRITTVVRRALPLLAKDRRRHPHRLHSGRLSLRHSLILKLFDADAGELGLAARLRASAKCRDLAFGRFERDAGVSSRLELGDDLPRLHFRVRALLPKTDQLVPRAPKVGGRAKLERRKHVQHDVHVLDERVSGEGDARRNLGQPLVVPLYGALHEPRQQARQVLAQPFDLGLVLEAMARVALVVSELTRHGHSVAELGIARQHLHTTLDGVVHVLDFGLVVRAQERLGMHGKLDVVAVQVPGRDHRIASSRQQLDRRRIEGVTALGLVHDRDAHALERGEVR
mmetsp:Transcript_6115/g.14989  ORF Transcript_6115/g.14989 Transcript_6115/m.14989 type:complete len:333 (-) Transcript_6115:620-1618(-)